ncbi:helix-turn-helix domain-containing protein [Pedobacter frigoris]|uniref:AraC family transcriptional regulator n=1 Tax=Pedobacter frigoris TaxID=2571272 RepID=A0A4U1CQ03_9SPHI|nr:helix-turn-helix domain-containing protein [Pedobacter frigoris]TKC09593.1 AraC family transcriptional regulator [Pedobacter frigoris]
MIHYIDLLSIQTPKHLRKGFENRTRFDCGNYEINIFETFQSSTKVEIKYEGLSISGMIRGRKVVYTKQGNKFDFLPGTSLILPEGETIFADFPDASEKSPVQCATILIPHQTIIDNLKYLNQEYLNEEAIWALDFKNFHFNNNASLVRAFNELINLATQKKQLFALNDLLLKSFLVRLIDAQNEHSQEVDVLNNNNQLFLIKNYIKENLASPLTVEILTNVGNCSKSTLYRLFDAYCSKSPGEYILNERMAHAQNLLLNPNSNVTEVAYLSGFSSVSYFAKQFKMVNNCTPGDFIKKFGM